VRADWVRSGNGPAVSRGRQGSATAVRASSHRAGERTVDERGLGLSQIRLGAERDQRPVIGALVIGHKHQSRIVEQEPAIIEPGSEDRVRAVATGLHDDEPQVLGRDAAFAQGEVFRDGVILAIPLPRGEGGERSAPDIAAVLLQIRNVADRQIDRAIDLAEQSAACFPRAPSIRARNRRAAGGHVSGTDRQPANTIASCAISSLTCNHFAPIASRGKAGEPRANGSGGSDGVRGSAASFTRSAGLIGASGARQRVWQRQAPGVRQRRRAAVAARIHAL
jgi:hypothetical protein